MTLRSRIEGKTSAELREAYIAHHFVPLCRRVFAKDPEVMSVVLTVGQYWSDEARDAVHLHSFVSADSTPRWPACLSDVRFMIIDPSDESSFGMLNDRGSDLVGWEATSDLPFLDQNVAAITAFAPYCLPGCDQDMPLSASLTPYAIGRRGRTSDEVVVDIVGTVHQPQWEDRFDVGFDAPDRR